MNKITVHKPITSSEREKIWETWQQYAGYVTHRNNKATFGKQDILGSDIVAYCPQLVVFSQVSTVAHLSDKRKQIIEAFKEPPESTSICIEIIGIDAHKEGGKIIIDRLVMERWLSTGAFRRTQLSTDIIERIQAVANDHLGPKK